jgi:hypothetical protein
MAKFAGSWFLVREFNHSTAITLGAITFAEVAVAINGTVWAVIIVFEGEEVIPTTPALSGFFFSHG